MSGYVRVTNVRRDMAGDSQPEPGETVVRIDRTNRILGNPFVLRNKNDMQERDRVISQYGRRLDEDIVRKGLMTREIDALAVRVAGGEKICLECWCSPLPCHGDVLAKEIMRRAYQLKRKPAP